MILTGRQIESEVRQGRIVIDDFDPARLEPNSYGFRLAPEILWYDSVEIDSRSRGRTVKTVMGEEGYLLQPRRLYLGSTQEAMGSECHAAELYASRSVATLGIWIQFSAPLGHSGAMFPWTLEIAVAAPVRVYPGMIIGKLAFWTMQGKPVEYAGRYTGSTSAVSSLMMLDREPSHLLPTLGEGDQRAGTSQALHPPDRKTDLP